MSQRNVELLIGQLATDEALRARFAAAPVALLLEMKMNGIEFNECELRSLAALDLRALARFADQVDPRLQKCDLHRGEK